MNTLRGNDIFNVFSQFEPFNRYAKAIQDPYLPIELYGTHGAFNALLIVETERERRKQGIKAPIIVVVPSEQEAYQLEDDIRFALMDVERFPFWGQVPYRMASNYAQEFGERCASLCRLVRGSCPIVIAVERAFLGPLPPLSYFKEKLFTIKKGDAIETVSLENTLSEYGYLKVPRVSVRGEFAMRGEVLDIWLPGYEKAIRIVFDFDKIEEIKLFSVEDQTSVENIKEITLYPVKEVLWTDERISFLEEKLSDSSVYPLQGKKILSQLKISRNAPGEELFYPLAFEKNSSLLDYAGSDALILYYDYDRLVNQAETLKREYTSMYKKARLDFDAPPPERLLYNFNELVLLHTNRVLFRTLKSDLAYESQKIDFGLDSARSFFGNIIYFKEELASLIKAGWKVYIFAESQVQADRISLVLKDFDVKVIPEAISQGFGIPALKMIVIQENEIFGRKKRIPKSVKNVKSAAIETFIELNPGDYVVHVNYGIGRFTGIDRMKVMGLERDYIRLEYADEETVFLPIEQVNLVQRYIGNEGNEPKLDRIGSKSWESRKSKVKKIVEDLAERLIRLYSKRKAAQGFAFLPDGEWQTAFEASFPYDETEDQLNCIADVKKDMESPKPMDRMICGDVGYGKTEIAMRACFKAVMSGKQVALLAPTTILAEQHYENLLDRVKTFPVRVGMMSRFVSKADQKKVLEGVISGDVDILIGTHRIIQKDIKFKDLGLMVIDEEQRFGVKDKERLKEIKTNIDCLTLTATPIPRTLHMSLLKIRDMSVLSTPPSNRQPVETFIAEYNEETVAEAIRREVARGGQVFFLHNRVESLEEVRIQLQNIVPEILVESAHGQMDPQDLDDVMHRFIHGGFHVLVSTTIIENGIDIPNVNTIIIDRADMFGISQLYQLKGRVGRSDRSSYAYLFYPEKRALSEIAMKRLQIISDFTELGSGFKIAMKDMEVRGAGNLLGREQSGEILSVGFDLYLKMLEEAVHKLKDENWTSEEDTYLELEYAGYIPESYIKAASIKMEVYKKIAAIGNQDELDRVYSELLDRFGPVPDELESLLALSEIRILCKQLSIKSVKEKGGSVEVEFSRVAKVSVDKVLRMMKESQGRVKLDPERPNILILKTGSIGLKEKSEFIREKLGSLGM